ncbi:MAG: hypothetical protein R3D98_01425 [Candidatus Krumholzibacteriia bacterium]
MRTGAIRAAPRRASASPSVSDGRPALGQLLPRGPRVDVVGVVAEQALEHLDGARVVALAAVEVGQGPAGLGGDGVVEGARAPEPGGEQLGGRPELQTLVAAQAELSQQAGVVGSVGEPAGEVGQGAVAAAEPLEIPQQKAPAAVAAHAVHLVAEGIEHHERGHGGDPETVGQRLAGGAVEVDVDQVEAGEFGLALGVLEDLAFQQAAGPAPGGREVEQARRVLAADHARVGQIGRVAPGEGGRRRQAGPGQAEQQAAAEWAPGHGVVRGRRWTASARACSSSATRSGVCR